MNKVVKWFKDGFSKSTYKLNVSEQNLKLLYENFVLCYTSKQIKIVKDVLNHCADSFEVNQRISITREILYREQLIDYCERRLKKDFYPIREMEAIIQQASEPFHCDAILLHLEKNYKTYHDSFSDPLNFFWKLKYRKAELLNNLKVEL